jgi:hypothetical protein
LVLVTIGLAEIIRLVAQTSLTPWSRRSSSSSFREGWRVSADPCERR